MYIIVGLGNPGEKYVRTRHNVGFIILDQLHAGMQNVDDWGYNKFGNGEYFWDRRGKEELLFIKPQTMMNNSGVTVRYARDKHDVSRDHVVVVYDDIDLPFGKVKISHDRGDGGHNGIKSIINHIGGADFTRIRIGISHDLGEDGIRKPNVLGNFSSEEVDTIHTIVETVSNILQTIIEEGREKAMNRFNSQT